jgi:hypothetical protein
VVVVHFLNRNADELLVAFDKGVRKYKEDKGVTGRPLMVSGFPRNSVPAMGPRKTKETDLRNLFGPSPSAESPPPKITTFLPLSKKLKSFKV